MNAFRLFLITYMLVLATYTAVTIAHHGPDLVPVFFGDMAKMSWPGQFNLDFMGFLMLSALWVGWRNRFSAGGLALAVVAFFGGMMFLTIYLLILTFRTHGDVRTILLGDREGQP